MATTATPAITTTTHSLLLVPGHVHSSNDSNCIPSSPCYSNYYNTNNNERSGDEAGGKRLPVSRDQIDTYHDSNGPYFGIVDAATYSKYDECQHSLKSGKQADSDNQTATVGTSTTAETPVVTVTASVRVWEGAERLFTPIRKGLDGKLGRAWTNNCSNEKGNHQLSKSFANGLLHIKSKAGRTFRDVNDNKTCQLSNRSENGIVRSKSRSISRGGKPSSLHTTSSVPTIRLELDDSRRFSESESENQRIKDERKSKYKRLQTNDGVGCDEEKNNVIMSNLSYVPFTSVGDKSFNTKRYLDDRVRSMYSQRRLTTPSSSRNIPSPRGGRVLSARRRHYSNAHQEEDHTKQNGHQNMDLVPLAKFRLVSRMTIVLIRLMKAIIKNSNDLTTRSAAELQWLTVYGHETEATMAFNKNLYSRDRVMTHIPEWAMSILQMEPESRTEQHCRRLHALLRGLKSFDKFTDEIQMSLCRAFRLEIVSEGRIVLKRGHIGVFFYFIYSGSVFVNAHDKTADGTTFMRTIAILQRGQSFGELALLQDIKRTATVSVREKCELLVVDKDVFARVCPKIFEKELEEKRTFLRGMSLFPSKWWSPEAMRALSMEAQIQEFKINKVIVPDSSLEDWIYTCIEGKCQVIHCLSLLSKDVDDTDNRRRNSDIVLSEEIIDLLSSATATVTKTNEKDVDDNIKEKLLSSLGLDYVASGKRRHAYVKDDLEKERLRAIQGLDDATTLTSLMKRREETTKGLVYLDVGVIEPGQVFDLNSLVSDDRDIMHSQSSSLMLVSGGAKILKVRKAAFFTHVTDQGLEHTRTLASKQRNLSDKALFQSYKEKKKWEKYKSDVVNSVLQTRRNSIDHRNQPSSSSRPSTSRPKSCRSRSARFSNSGSSGRSSRPISSREEDRNNHNEPSPAALPVVQKENQTPQQPASPTSDIVVEETCSPHPSNYDKNKRLSLQSERSSLGMTHVDKLESLSRVQPSFKTDVVIIRRRPMGSLAHGRISRNVTARPHTVHPRFSSR